MGKGGQRERELVRILDENNIAVMRAPGSGAGTKRELPDVLAGKSTGNGDPTFVAIEAKSGQSPIYIPTEEIVDLGFFAQNFGAEPYCGFGFDKVNGGDAYGEDNFFRWRFIHVDNLQQISENNYKVTREEAQDSGLLLSDLFDSVEKPERSG